MFGRVSIETVRLECVAATEQFKLLKVGVLACERPTLQLAAPAAD
jgi:hypothetical protein